VDKVAQTKEAPRSPPSEPHREERPLTLRLNGELKLSTNAPTEPAAGSDRDPAPLPVNRPGHSEHHPAASLHPASGPVRSEPRPVPGPRPVATPLAVAAPLPAPAPLAVATPLPAPAPLAVAAPLPVTAPQRPLGFSATTSRGLAVTDGLDSELHQRAEAAIETFRSCFDATLAEGSPQQRARLRQAASDLMRVAARTTIVLDRLNAVGERA